jgi:hypothetical protein
MKTPLEWFLTEFQKQVWFEPNSELDIWIKDLIPKAKEKETELLLHVIKCYHNNLFFVPLNENGEAQAILELILSGQIKSKLDI